MKNAVKIFSFTILVAVFYSYVGQMVPQKITYPPEETALSADMTVEEMVAVGEELVAGKGTCLGCHTMGEEGALRFPDLAGIGAVAGERIEGYNDIDYLAESLYEPDVFIVEGFQSGMPAISKPPIALTDEEILTVIAYLQSLGGTPTVTLDTDHRWIGQGAAPSTGGGETAAAVPTTNRDGETLFAAFLCNTCHSLDGTAGVGPTLQGIGQKLDRAALYEAIMAPDATIAEGYQAGLMSATLTSTGFYDKISTKEVNNLVDYLAGL